MRSRGKKRGGRRGRRCEVGAAGGIIACISECWDWGGIHYGLDQAARFAE